MLANSYSTSPTTYGFGVAVAEPPVLPPVGLPPPPPLFFAEVLGNSYDTVAVFLSGLSATLAVVTFIKTNTSYAIHSHQKHKTLYLLYILCYNQASTKPLVTEQHS